MQVEETRGKWVRIQAGVDSCAADNVLPSLMFPGIKTVETRASRNGKEYSAANGGAIKNEGEKVVSFTTHCGKRRKIKFQVAKVTKVLLSASKIAKAGFIVKLDAEDPYIMDRITGEKMTLKHQNGIFGLDLWVNTEEMGRVFSRQGP